MVVPTPEDNADPQNEIRSQQSSRTVPVQELEDIAYIASCACGADYTGVCLITDDQTWITASTGFEMYEPVSIDWSFFCNISRNGPLWVPDLSTDLRFNQHPSISGDTGMRCCAAYPVQMQDGTQIGTVFVACRTPFAFRSRSLLILEALSRQALSFFNSGLKDLPNESTVENGHADPNRNELDRFATIVEAQHAVSGADLNTDTLTALIAQKTQEMICADATMLLTLESGRLRRHATAGNSSRFSQAKVESVSSFTGSGTVPERMIHCADCASDIRFARLAIDPGVRSFICVPLTVADVHIGVLEAVSSRPRAFTARDVQTIELMAGLASASLTHAADFSAKKELLVQRTDALTAVKESEDRFRSAIEAAEEGLVVVDTAGNGTLCNSQAICILGLSEEQILGRVPRPSGWRVIDENGRAIEESEHPVFDTLNTGAKHKGIVRGIRRRSGSWVWVSVNTTPLQRAGEPKPYGAVVTYTDITQQRVAEEERIVYLNEVESARAYAEEQAYLLQQQANELEIARDDALESTRIKSEFLANMSHEIRTPMNGVMGMTELIFATELTEEQRDYVSVIRSSADALLTVINDILDFSKIESGKMCIEEEPFDLHSVIEEAVGLLAHKAEQKNLDLIVSIPDNVPCNFIGDRGRIRQVLLNLVGNAIKFTDVGTVDVSVHAVRLTDATHQIKIAVHDSGIGIPAARQQSIFESFTQADGSTTRKYGGSGLGLTISRQLARLMGGDLGLTSDYGEGSTFWLELTLDAAQSNSMNCRDTTACTMPLPEGLRILLAEDNAVNRLVAVKMLQKMGLSVTSVSNGLEACEAANASEYKIILMDIQMPEMDGLEAAMAIRHAEKQSHRPRSIIIAMTAHAMEGDKERCLSSGMDEYVTKPVKMEDLYQKLVWSCWRLGLMGQTSDAADQAA